MRQIDGTFTEVLKFKKIDKNLEMVNLGTGPGYYDFNYQMSEVKAFNFALPQQTLEYDMKLLKRYHSHLKSGCKVMIVLPYFIFCVHSITNYFNVYKRYYPILPWRENRDSSLLKKLIYQLYWSCLVKSDSDSQFTIYQECTQDIVLMSKEAVRLWTNQLGLVSMQSGIITERVRNEACKVKKVLGELTEYCVKMGFEPVLVIPPACSELNQMISDKFLKVHFYDNLYETVKNKYIILDYSHDLQFQDSSLYQWPLFLNRRGSVAFTQRVISDLK